MKPSGSDSENTGSRLSGAQVMLVLLGLVAPLLTFFLAVSSLSEGVKIFILVALAVGYSLILFWTFLRSHKARAIPSADDLSKAASLQERLSAIGEASEFFGAALKPDDLFRLVSSRIAEVFPFTNSALLVAAAEKDALEIAQADGPNADALLGVELPIERGLAGMAWVSNEIEIDTDLKLEGRAMPAAAITGVHSAVAIPLQHERKVFAVLVLYRDQKLSVDSGLGAILEAIGERVSPLFLSSLSVERSISNALTDTLTNLPNERAFYMILENQLAESQRFRNERPLTVMTVDIKNFAEVNQSFGYAAGDRMLAFTADNLTTQLRKMDFLSRATNDEFLIILPTASEKFAVEIIGRIRERFATEVFPVTETEELKIWLNVGWATFWQDGETAEQLLQNARVRKQQAKAEEPSKILWFPKEYVN